MQELVNSEGLTEEEVEEAKKTSASTIHDDHFEEQTYHFIIAGIHIKNLSNIHPVQLK